MVFNSSKQNSVKHGQNVIAIVCVESHNKCVYELWGQSDEQYFFLFSPIIRYNVDKHSSILLTIIMVVIIFCDMQYMSCSNVISF